VSRRWHILLGLAALLMAEGAAAQVVPWHSPFPHPRPSQIGPQVTALPSGSLARAPATDAAVALALSAQDPLRGAAPAVGAVTRSVLPRPRPSAAAARFAAAPVQPARAVSRAPTPAGTVERGVCGVRALEGRRLSRITASTRGCGVAEPVSVTRVHGVALSQPATLHCDMARALGDWVDDALVPAVGRRGGGVAELTVIAHYSCRTRNSRRGARISEHGRGMAIDIAGYVLQDGERVRVIEDYRRGRHRRDLRAMYREACGTFTTTLGPDADRFHQDHFHFDLARHRGGGTYCR
jgi:hypothetical protein